MGNMSKPNWFHTLNEALEAEDLVAHWDAFRSIDYGEMVRFHFTRDYKEYTAVIYRETNGMYERPVVYCGITFRN